MKNTENEKVAQPQTYSIARSEIEKLKRTDKSLGELFEAYLHTNYVVKDEDVFLTIRIQEKNFDLDNLFNQSQTENAAFMTAYNPYSKELSRTENESRQKKLIKLLNEKGYKFFYGYGEDETGEWQPEPSLFILGIEFQNALKLARKFKQNAFIYLEKGKAPILISSL